MTPEEKRNRSANTTPENFNRRVEAVNAELFELWSIANNATVTHRNELSNFTGVNHVTWALTGSLKVHSEALSNLMMADVWDGTLQTEIEGK